MVKISADDKASDVIQGVGDKASRVASAIGTGLKVAGAAAVAGTALIAKSSLDMYSSYEQNLGGVQKIFGNMGKSLEDYAALTGQTVDAAADKWKKLEAAQSTMMANASKAWQTAGLSASAYMEQSTSFGAALVSSLGGDTQKAAEYANRAIIDMADNANTFGTSIGDIQNAYQGFAKQNYTMLDNLKLGYGGTQSEMKRLINDASKMTDVQKKLGVTVDSSSMSFDNIVNAIHVMQESMQVGGTTAREAATTIEGSVNAMRAAWDNWLTGLGDSDADMSQLTENLVSSFEIAADNVVPRIAEILGTLIGTVPGIVAEVGPVAAQALQDTFMTAAQTFRDMLPQEAQSALDGVVEKFQSSGLADAVGNSLSSIAGFGAKAADGISQLMESFDESSAMEDAATVIDTVAGFIEHLADQAGEYLMPALENAGKQLGLLGQAFQDAQVWMQPLADMLGNILVAAVILVVDAFTLAVGIVTTVLDAITDFVNFLIGVPASVQSFVDQVGAFFGQLPGLIGGFLAGVIASIGAWASGVVQWALDAGSGFVSNIGSFLMGLPGSVAGWLAGVISTVAGWVSQFGANAASAASEFGNRLRDGLASIPGTLGNIGSNIISGIVNGITGAAGRVRDAIGNAIGNAMDFAKHILGIASPSKVFKRYGYYVMKGMELGISQNAGLPLNATEEAMRAVADVEPASPTAPYMQAANASGQVLDWLQSNLGDVIAECTPVMGESEFGRKARKAVAYA